MNTLAVVIMALVIIVMIVDIATGFDLPKWLNRRKSNKRLAREAAIKEQKRRDLERLKRIKQYEKAKKNKLSVR